jgi:chromosome segregation ATPase
VLDTLTQHEAVSSETLNENMKALELERERVNMELYAKQERRRALAAQMDQIKATLSDKVQGDEVLEQLNKIVDGRVAAVKRMQEMQKANAATTGEVEELEGKVAEAKARVAERKELLRQSNGADILSRMTADLAGGMVDVAELEARKHYIDSQLPNIATVTEDQLKGILQTSQYPAPTNKPPPLREELEKKHDDLLYQWGVLLVKDVRLHSENSATSQPAAGDRGR